MNSQSDGFQANIEESREEQTWLNDAQRQSRDEAAELEGTHACTASLALGEPLEDGRPWVVDYDMCWYGLNFLKERIGNLDMCPFLISPLSLVKAVLFKI